MFGEHVGRKSWCFFAVGWDDKEIQRDLRIVGLSWNHRFPIMQIRNWDIEICLKDPNVRTVTSLWNIVLTENEGDNISKLLFILFHLQVHVIVKTRAILTMTMEGQLQSHITFLMHVCIENFA